MKVAVIGPGAMGCLFAARLTDCGIETVLVDHDGERAKRLSAAGIVVDEPTTTTKVSLEVTTTIPSDVDLQLLCTKAHCTRDVNFLADIPVLTLQNGLGNAETISEQVGSANLLAGVTFEASTLLEEGHVRHAGSGLTSFGAWTTCSVEDAAAALERAGFRVDLTDAPGQKIWQKVAINSAINPLTALLNVPNGILVEIPETRQVLRDLVVEATKVATLEGYRFPYSLVELAEETCRNSADNISSMLQDVRAGKRTEIEALSGEILRRAQGAGLPTPRTRMAYQLLKGLEQR